MGFGRPASGSKALPGCSAWTLAPVFTTAQTVVIGTPEQMAASAAALWEKGATLLKIKLDARLISERMVAIRSAVPEATLIVGRQ
ncbi:mandelate racemase / muconate lactonizing enzyme family protein [Salmonella enterica subsp. enterica]|uniref:Mandelate racemase / muconate lactonizing enzyme family protein n=1 Tax=Salmonella enterica I TaxID=59201 RepID=A0A379WUE5_SALET|nr:mandelate racemase / muconate lactonizing enzyme family protein [Salmonella enterica subsp. enterica]